MRLGLNLPWIDCGHDFGRRPPAWGHGERPKRDWPALEDDLARWREELGIEVVRMWLLAGGVNYPVGEDPLDRFGITAMRPEDAFLARWPRVLRRALVGAGWDSTGGGSSTSPRRLVLGDAELPPLPDDFLEDFQRLLEICGRAGVRLMPVLTSFEFFHPLEEQLGGVLSRGRTALVFGDDGRDLEQIDRFLDATLSPILQVCRTRRDAVEAVEVINEPDWSTEGGPLHARMEGRRLRLMPKLVRAPSMCAFLDRATTRILADDFVATIGFKQADPPWISQALRARLAALGREGRYVHQVHHYPSLYEPGRLPYHDDLPITPCIVGEMPTIQGSLFGLHVAWWREHLSTIPRAADPNEFLARRLEIVESRGYPMALLWSARGHDIATDWSDSVRAQVARFGVPGNRR